MKFRMFLMITGFVSLILALSVGWQLHRLRQGRELCAAIRHENTSVALALLHSGADPNTRVPLALDTTSMQALRRLWNHWRNPQQAANADYSASVLQLAVQKDNAPVVKDLLERGASDINALVKPDEDHSYEEPRSLVIVVAKQKHPELAWMFLKRGAAKSQEDKERLLCAAAYADDLELVRYLINSGINADGGAKWEGANEPDRLPPLVHAVHNRNFAMATLLLEHHARGNARYSLSSTLDTIVEEDDQLRINAPYALNSTLTDAAENGDNAMVKLLVTHGADVNLAVRFGSPLCFAAESGNLDVVKTLVAAGADVNYNGYGGTPLDHAAKITILKFLLRKGANVNAHGKYGATILFGAAYHNNIETVKLLLDNGAEIN